MTYEKIVDYVQKKFAKLDVSKTGDVAVQIDVTGEGEGAFYVAVKEGKFIGPPMLKMAEKILAKHKKIISKI